MGFSHHPWWLAGFQPSTFRVARLESGKCPYGFTLYLGPSVFKGLMMAGEKCEYLNIV